MIMDDFIQCQCLFTMPGLPCSIPNQYMITHAFFTITVQYQDSGRYLNNSTPTPHPTLYPHPNHLAEKGFTDVSNFKRLRAHNQSHVFLSFSQPQHVCENLLWPNETPLLLQGMQFVIIGNHNALAFELLFFSSCNGAIHRL